MASRTFTVREILDMAVDELKKALVDLDPSVDTKGMTKATMQELLMERCVEKTHNGTDFCCDWRACFCFKVAARVAVAMVDETRRKGHFFRR